MKLATRLSTAVVLAGLVSAAPAAAQDVAYSGSTLGCFYNPSDVPCTPVANATLGDLTFSGNTFSGTTSGGFGAIGSLASSLNNLGTFTLPGATSTPRNFTTAPANFRLFVTWSTPGGVVPSPLPYLAMLSGVIGTSGGGVSVLFEAAAKPFTFTGGAGALRLNTVSLNNNNGTTTVPVTGDFRITATTVPEPSTYVLMASGLAGLLMFGKRRKNNA